MEELRVLIINLAAAAIGGIAVVLWTRFLRPILIENFGEPTRLAKEYEAILDFGNGPNHRIRVELSKLGREVNGTLRFVEGKHQGKEYSVKGMYRNPILSFYYWAKPGSGASQGAGTFIRLHDGLLFKGYFAYYSQETDSISAVPCDLKPS